MPRPSSVIADTLNPAYHTQRDMDERKDKFRVNPTVVATPMPDGAVLIDSATGECFELNRIGARVWERLQRGEDLVAIVDALASEYALERSRVSTDVANLVENLARHGIVVGAPK
jgi:hypothetical protein